MIIAEKAEENIVAQNNIIFHELSFPVFYKLSFQIKLDSYDSRQISQRILHITNDSPFDLCGARWSQIWIQPGHKLNLRHAFQCLDTRENDDHIYTGNENLSIGEWHLIEYLQLPYKNSAIGELIIRINGVITHKIANRNPKHYDDMKVYFGGHQASNKFHKNSSAKIKNFKISRFLQGYFCLRINAIYLINFLRTSISFVFQFTNKF